MGWPGPAKKPSVSMKRPAASLAFGETYGAKMPTEENKGEKKKPPVVDDLTMMYRSSMMNMGRNKSVKFLVSTIYFTTLSVSFGFISMWNISMWDN